MRALRSTKEAGVSVPASRALRPNWMPTSLSGTPAYPVSGLRPMMAARWSSTPQRTPLGFDGDHFSDGSMPAQPASPLMLGQNAASKTVSSASPDGEPDAAP